MPVWGTGGESRLSQTQRELTTWQPNVLRTLSAAVPPPNCPLSLPRQTYTKDRKIFQVIAVCLAAIFPAIVYRKLLTEIFHCILGTLLEKDFVEPRGSPNVEAHVHEYAMHCAS